MRWPLNSVSVSQEFASTAIDYSQFGLKGHHGIDLVASVGTPVYAPEAGKVLQSANGVTDPKSGKFVAGETIVMSGKYEHWLMHLSKRNVSAGQTVTEGQLIGYTGNTGFTTGPHLHWGTRPLNPDMNNGYRGFVNPRNVIKQGGNVSADKATREEVDRQYLLGLGRHADASGLKNFTGKPINFIADSLRKSAEWKARDAKAKAPSVYEQVKETLFRRKG